MQDSAIPLYSGLLPILVVLGMELVLSGLLLHSVVLRKILCGKPVILIREGKIDLPNLRRTRVTLDELCGHMRFWRRMEVSLSFPTPSFPRPMPRMPG